MRNKARDLGCDTTITVGDRVKSYDFPDNTPEDRELCYKVGTVEAIVPVEGCNRYRIKVESGVFEGIPDTRLPEYIIPPVNGTPTWMDHICNGVVKI